MYRITSFVTKLSQVLVDQLFLFNISTKSITTQYTITQMSYIITQLIIKHYYTILHNITQFITTHYYTILHNIAQFIITEYKHNSS